jgi:hypothetical protein
MQISKPEIIQHEDETTYQVKVESADGAETLWYSLQSKFAGLLTDSCDAPLVALLIPAMANGEDIHIAGAISEMLYYNLSRPYQRLLQHIIPSLHTVQIHPDTLRSSDRPAPGVAAAFSGGIDSFSTLGNHFLKEVPASFKITHLLYNNIGSHGTNAELKFRRRYTSLAPMVEQMGLPFIRTHSNLDSFYQGKPEFRLTHTPRNASVALLYQNGIGRYMYSSAVSYPSIVVKIDKDMGYTDGIALPLLSTERLNAISVGSEYTRVEKTLLVAEISASYDTLDVCAHGDNERNCSKCSKCMMTLLTLEIAGVMDRYSTSFNLDTYRQGRNKFIDEVLWNPNPLRREILNFAKERGYRFPFWMVLNDRLHRPFSQLKRLAALPALAARKLRKRPV